VICALHNLFSLLTTAFHFSTFKRYGLEGECVDNCVVWLMIMNILGAEAAMPAMEHIFTTASKQGDFLQATVLSRLTIPCTCQDCNELCWACRTAVA
jgi:hypothetical protein